ncbi:IS982 family transposase [Streptomyces olivoverticillatus]
MTNELDTLLTALYVKIDDDLEVERWMGCPPRLSDAELVTLAVAQALLGFHSEARWLRYACKNLAAMFPYLPQQSGYNKRLKAALPLVKKAIRMLAVDTDFWFDNHWIADSTPVECGRSRPMVKRSEMAGWAGYGYCASHSRFFWGLRLYLVCTPTGMPILWALANPKLDEREVLQAMLDVEEDLAVDRPGLLLIADKGFASKEFEVDLAMRGIDLLRPSFKREKKRKGEFRVLGSRGPRKDPNGHGVHGLAGHQRPPLVGPDPVHARPMAGHSLTDPPQDDRGVHTVGQ